MTSTDPVVSPVATGSGWPASVRVCCTRREAQGPGYPGLNVGLHVGDDQARVLHNRRRLVAAGVPPVVWLDQVHGREVARVVEVPESPPTADAAWTAVPDLALAIMVADCLPVVLTDAQGNAVAGVHCGWRGLVAGVLEATLDAFQSEDLRACFGPCIGPCHYEVGAEVADRFRETPGVVCTRSGSLYVDLYAEATARLRRRGVRCGPRAACTHCAPGLYSYRRDGVTGRQALIAWKE